MMNCIYERDRIVRNERERLSRKMFERDFRDLNEWEKKEVQIQLRRVLSPLRL